MLEFGLLPSVEVVDHTGGRSRVLCRSSGHSRQVSSAPVGDECSWMTTLSDLLDLTT